MTFYHSFFTFIRSFCYILPLIAATPVMGFSFILVDTGNDVADAPDLTPLGLLTNPGPDGSISLREAILANNSLSPGASLNIMVSGETIRPVSELPPITRGPLSMMGSGGAEIDGSGMTGTGTGLTIGASGVRVTGFVVKNFPGDGLQVVGDSIKDSSFGQVEVHGNAGHGLLLDFRDVGCINYCFLVYNGFFYDNSKSAILSSSGNVRVEDTTVREGIARSSAPNGGYGIHLDPSGRSQLTVGPSNDYRDHEFGHVIEVLEGEEVEIATTLSAPPGGSGRWYLDGEVMVPEDSSTTLTLNAIPFPTIGKFDYRIANGDGLVTARSPSVDVMVRSPAEVHASENILFAFFELNESNDPFHLDIDDAQQIGDHPSIIEAFEALDADDDGILSIDEVYRDLFARADYSIGRVDPFLRDLPMEVATTSTLNLAISVGPGAGRPLRVLDVITFHGTQFTQFFPPADQGTISPGNTWEVDLEFVTEDLIEDAGFILLETDSFVLPYVLIPLVTDAFQQELDLVQAILGRKRVGEDDVAILDQNSDGLIDSGDLIGLGLDESIEERHILRKRTPRTTILGDDQAPIAGDLIISTTGYGTLNNRKDFSL